MIYNLATLAALALSCPLVASKAHAEWIEAELTAYSPRCPHCVGKRHPDGIGASGLRIVPGLHLAADKSIPFGTRVYIRGQWWIVADRGGKVKGKRLDLALESHRAAKRFALQREKVWIDR